MEKSKAKEIANLCSDLEQAESIRRLLLNSYPSLTSIKLEQSATNILTLWRNSKTERFMHVIYTAINNAVEKEIERCREEIANI